MNGQDDLTAVLERLYRRRTFGIRPGLEMTNSILDQLDRPQDGYRVIHVAGTNGKGSVCAMLDAVLREAGLRTALYSSPHLVRFNERFRINGEPIADSCLAEVLAAVEGPSDAAAGRLGREATFFEYTTAAAFEHFRRSGVEVAVVETGMGGRLDSTNVVDPALAVITRIDMDHTAYLGNTLSEIAGEKCGIIKQGRPLVSGPMDEDAAAVVAARAAAAGILHVQAAERVGIRVKSVDWSGQKVEVGTENVSYGTIRFPLVGEHQVENLAIAVAAIEVLEDVVGIPVSREHLRAGIAGVRWPGRFQVLRRDPVLVIDGAHNPSGARTLARTLDRLSGEHPIGLVVGMCDDKDIRGFLAEFVGRAARLWAVPIASERSVSPSVIEDTARFLGMAVSATELAGALLEAERWSRDAGGIVCAAGSLFLVGEILGRWEEEH